MVTLLLREASRASGWAGSLRQNNLGPHKLQSRLQQGQPASQSLNFFIRKIGKIIYTILSVGAVISLAHSRETCQVPGSTWDLQSAC